VSLENAFHLQWILDPALATCFHSEWIDKHRSGICFHLEWIHKPKLVPCVHPEWTELSVQDLVSIANGSEFPHWRSESIWNGTVLRALLC